MWITTTLLIRANCARVFEYWGLQMNRKLYQSTRRSIRDNGLRYTAQHAIDTDNMEMLFVCDEIANTLKQTDWLAMRVQFARSETPKIALKLTCSEWLLRREMDKPIVWGN